jgi:hypothetical protein
MSELKLIALDAEDSWPVLSANLQDAVLRVADVAYLPREKRFAAIANRFDWAGATDRHGHLRAPPLAMRFERVLGAQLHGIDLANKGTVLALLAISFEPAEAPEGHVILHFADGAANPAARRVHRGRDEGPGAGLAGEIQAASPGRGSRQSLAFPDQRAAEASRCHSD